MCGSGLECFRSPRRPDRDRGRDAGIDGRSASRTSTSPPPGVGLAAYRAGTTPVYAKAARPGRAPRARAMLAPAGHRLISASASPSARCLRTAAPDPTGPRARTRVVREEAGGPGCSTKRAPGIRPAIRTASSWCAASIDRFTRRAAPSSRQRDRRWRPACPAAPARWWPSRPGRAARRSRSGRSGGGLRSRARFSAISASHSAAGNGGDLFLLSA